MELFLRYCGEFLDVKGKRWRVEIHQAAAGPFGEVGELTMEADEPLLIEWEERSKEEAVCGSTARLRVESPGDRTYEDLYTVEPGRIRADVYYEGRLYWCGTLDPEFYEEPYERASNYPVELTFSDFGILDRLKFELSGRLSLWQIISNGLERSGIMAAGTGVESGLTSTFFADEPGVRASIEALSIRSENFYDEDGEALTMLEAIEGVLQPLGLRMVQRSGCVWIYDLNALYERGAQECREICWSGESQRMGVDRVYNNVRITFSPYADSGLIGEEFKYMGEVDRSLINLLHESPAGKPEHFSYFPFYGKELDTPLGRDEDLVDFTIFLTRDWCPGLKLGDDKRVKFFHIEPLTGGGSEAEGVACLISTGHKALTSSSIRRDVIKRGMGPKDGFIQGEQAMEIMRTGRVSLPALSEEEAKGFYLRLTLEMLFDARYNPMSSAGDGNEKAADDAFKKYGVWAFVRVDVKLYDEEGNVRAYYQNVSPLKGTEGHMKYAAGNWMPGPPPYKGMAWLEYYNEDDPKKGGAVGGWQGNRQCIGRPDWVRRLNSPLGRTDGTFVMFESFARMDDGQYLPYPAGGGSVEVTVYGGVLCYGWGEDDRSNSLTYTPRWDNRISTGLSLNDSVRWHLYKAPRLEVVRTNATQDEMEMDDVEYSGRLNRDAKDELSLDTICGTVAEPAPTARGIYLRSRDGRQVQRLCRAGVTDHPEMLLIGTLYSQFARRHTRLDGECEIDTAGLGVYAEANQPGKLFLMAGERQDVRTGCSDGVFVELSPDEWERDV